MFFVLSKVLLIFILPVTWIIAFLIASLIVKKPKLKRRLLITSVILLLIFTNPFLFNIFVRNWDVRTASLKPGQYSCAIVLGGFSGEDRDGNGFFNAAADRFIQGLKLLNTGKASHILITSGNGMLIHDSFKEADWAKTQLLQLKVPDSCILIEDQSRNTIENAEFSKKVLAGTNLKPPYILVTSAFHMRRALGIFKKAKLDVVPYSCNNMEDNSNISVTQFIPDSMVLGGWNFYNKEVVGVMVNWFK
jgi:uncharacterized SAM-binding protein YcdF (DUF218 family)